ncbi:hypothetical protein ACJX0J_036619, partial [Zea mays]
YGVSIQFNTCELRKLLAVQSKSSKLKVLNMYPLATIAKTGLDGSVWPLPTGVAPLYARSLIEMSQGHVNSQPTFWKKKNTTTATVAGFCETIDIPVRGAALKKIWPLQGKCVYFGFQSVVLPIVFKEEILKKKDFQIPL